MEWRTQVLGNQAQARPLALEGPEILTHHESTVGIEQVPIVFF